MPDAGAKKGAEPMKRMIGRVAWIAGIAGAIAQTPAATGERHFRAQDVFDPAHPVMFRDDFTSGGLDRWDFSEDDRYRLERETPERIRVVDAPGLAPGRKAVRFFVPRAPNSFRAEISLPSERGFQERWYGARVLIPTNWMPDAARGNDIVLQWHAIPGSGQPTNPNLAISVAHTNWHVRQTFGDPPDHKKGWKKDLDDPVRPGEWVAWVIHAKWSPKDDGRIRIWKDGHLVVERTGVNVYTTIGVEYTPYLKTGIYHPEWHLDNDRSRTAFDAERPVATNKIVYVTDVKIGDARATYDDVAPAGTPRPENP